MKQIFLMITTMLVVSETVSKTLPADATQLLKTLPTGKVTLDVVVGAGVGSSDSFKQVSSLYYQLEAPELAAQAPFATRLTASYESQNVQAEAKNPAFEPEKLSATVAKLGLQKKFSSGTQFAFEVGQTNSDYDFTNPNVTTDKVNEATSSISLKQSLWKNSFGHSSRKQLKQGEVGKQELQGRLDSSLEEWLGGMVGVFYKAWFAQASTEVAKKSLALRRRLLSTTQKKLKRGTAEKPDLLQAKSALLANQTRFSDSYLELGDVWRNLVVTLKFPSKWMSIDPLLVPIALDDPVPEAIKACGPDTDIGNSPGATAQLRALDKGWQKSKLQVEMAKDSFRPDLSLGLAASYNGVDSANTSDAWDESFAGDHPTYVVGLSLSIPLEDFAEKAKLQQAMSEKVKAEAAFKAQQSQQEVDWLNSCLKLHQQVIKTKKLKQALENQTLRSQLEEEKFRLGRSNLQAVIMAADDVNSAHLAYLQSEMSTRLASWQVKKMNGSSLEYVKKFIEAPGLK